MNKPKLVIFEYGQTLLRRTAANPHFALKMIFKNQDDEVFEQIRTEYLKQIDNPENCGIRSIIKDISDKFDVAADVPFARAEDILTGFGMEHTPDPHAEELLDYFEKQNIKTAISGRTPISQNGLMNIFRRIFPESAMPIIAVSAIADYKELFDSILSQCNHEESDVWFCGSSKDAIETAAQTGIIPVFCNDRYQYLETWNGETKNVQSQQEIPQCDFIKIDSTIDLLSIINDLQ